MTSKTNDSKKNNDQTNNKSTANKKTTSNQASFSPQLINHLNSLKYVSANDLSDLYSKIGINSANMVSSINDIIDTTDPNLIIVNDKKIIKEYQSKNDVLYNVIIKNNADPDLTVEICLRHVKKGNDKMTSYQFYQLLSDKINQMDEKMINMSANMATKDDIKKIREEMADMATKDDIKKIREEMADMATKEDIKRLDDKIEKLKIDNNLK